jgi:hypothetical protein
MNRIKNIQWKHLRWFLLGCVPLFFFLRGIHLILTGGGWIAKTNQPAHWMLLFLEIFIAAFATFGCFKLWYKKSYVINEKKFQKSIFIRTISSAIIFTFIIHFIRVGFWIQNTML